MPVLIGCVMDTMGMREGLVILAAGTVLAGLSISLLFVDRIYASEPDPPAAAGVSSDN